MEACREMRAGEVLNFGNDDYPLYQVTIYGDKVLCAKLSKRVSCAIKHLPIRVEFHYEYSTQKAIEKGIVKDPTLVLNGEIFIEGLISSEEIAERFSTKIERN